MSYASGNGNGQFGFDKQGDAFGTPHDLPPVEPPSGQFIVRLFLIPLAVVVGLVGGWWLLVGLPFGKLAGGERDPTEYVNLIKTRNDARRDRAAFELATLIKNDRDLARDPRLLGSLAELLADELARKGLKGEPTGDVQIERFLAIALGIFDLPEGISSSRKPIDPISPLITALDEKYPVEVRQAAAESLARLAGRHHDTLKNPAAVRALSRAAQAESLALRERAIFALGFFADDEALSFLRKRLESEDPYVRYNAAVPLIRRDDLAALPVAREMLSPKDLERSIRGPTPSETHDKMISVQLEALQALELSIKQNRSSALAEKLRGELAALNRTGSASVRTQAAEVLQLLSQRSKPAGV